MIEKDNKKIVREIQKLYKEGYGLKTEDQIFHHLLKQVEKHIPKIANLKDVKEEEERFKREIADLYLITLGLMELEKVDQTIIKKAAEYYLNKLKENSKNRGREK